MGKLSLDWPLESTLYLFVIGDSFRASEARRFLEDSALSMVFTSYNNDTPLPLKDWWPLERLVSGGDRFRLGIGDEGGSESGPVTISRDLIGLSSKAVRLRID